jgi:hypothetical protein
MALSRVSGNATTAQDRLAAVSRAFFRVHGDTDWKATDAIFWLTTPAQPKVQVVGKWFFRTRGPQYEWCASSDGSLLEYCVWAALATETEPVRLSLGVCRTTDGRFSRASDHGVGAPLHRSLHGTLVQIMAVAPQRRGQDHSGINPAEHMQKVVWKKGLNLNKGKGRMSMLPLFAVLTTREAHDAQQCVTDPQSSDHDYLRALNVLEGPEWHTHHPWAIVNRLNDASRARIVQLLTSESSLRGDLCTEIAPGIVLKTHRMSGQHAAADQVCAWRAASQSRRSASIPLGKLYIPILYINAHGEEAFALYRRA